MLNFLISFESYSCNVTIYFHNLIFKILFMQSTVQYYALEGYYSHMRTSLLSLLKRFGSDPLLLFWRGFSMLLEGMCYLHGFH